MLQCGWTLRTLLSERNQTKRSHLYKTFRTGKFIETVKIDVCQGLGDGSDCLMGAGFFSGWWKSSGTAEAMVTQSCWMYYRLLNCSLKWLILCEFHPPPQKKHPTHRILFYIIWNRSPLRQCEQHRILCQHHCILVSWVIPLNHVVWSKSLQLCRLRGFLFHVLSGAVLGITDKMEAWPQPPLLVPQAWTRDEGVRPFNSDLFFPLLSWVDWKGILRCLLFLRGTWEAQSLLQLCSENNS